MHRLLPDPALWALKRGSPGGLFVWQPPCIQHDAFITDTGKFPLLCSLTSTVWFLLISILSLSVIEPQEESRKKLNAQKLYSPTPCLSLLSCLPAPSRDKSTASGRKKIFKENWVVYPKNTDTLIWKDICAPVFAAALFTIAKIWKQPKCPSVDNWIKKMRYYTQ